MDISEQAFPVFILMVNKLFLRLSLTSITHWLILDDFFSQYGQQVDMTKTQLHLTVTWADWLKKQKKNQKQNKNKKKQYGTSNVSVSQLENLWLPLIFISFHNYCGSKHAL